MNELRDTIEIDDFRRRSVLAICAAGSDRSGYIAQELNRRGYFATQAGVMRGHNYVTTEDLVNVGIVVFSSVKEKYRFNKDKRLSGYVKRNGIEIRILNITESDKDLAHNTGNIEQLRKDISRQLDCVGLRDRYEK